MFFVLVGLLSMAMAEQSIQLTANSGSETKFYGLVATSIDAEKALNDSGLFFPSHSVKLFERKFIVGTIHGLNVVYVRSEGTPSVHVGITVQILCDNFDIYGIIHYTSASSTNDKLSIGDVVVPSKYYFTGVWEWLNKDSGDLKIGEYNVPAGGSNALGSLLYDKELEYYVDDLWIYFASLANIQIDGAQVVVGSKASSSDIYLSNPYYRKFLYDQFGLETADKTGAAFLLGALSNKKWNIVFLGISNEGGAGSATSNYDLAYGNAFTATAQFLNYLTTLPIHHAI